jgi:hypothetical protein
MVKYRLGGGVTYRVEPGLKAQHSRTAISTGREACPRYGNETTIDYMPFNCLHLLMVYPKS